MFKGLLKFRVWNSSLSDMLRVVAELADKLSVLGTVSFEKRTAQRGDGKIEQE